MAGWNLPQNAFVETKGTSSHCVVEEAAVTVILSMRNLALRNSAMRHLMITVALCLASAAQAQTPPSQPAYPSSPQKRVVTPAQRERASESRATERRCDELKGLEKSECERRDVSNDDAPAGVTRSMREKEEKARAEEAAAASTTSAANPRSDTAGVRTASTPPSTTDKAAAPQKEKENADAAKAPASQSDTESDTLDRPRQPN
jgi:hypothetical protein